jgi:hypothetical protein
MRLGWDTGISIKQFGGGGSKRSTGTLPVKLNILGGLWLSKQY